MRSRRSPTSVWRRSEKPARRHGIHIGIHTLSAVNVAEVAPHVRDGVDRYLHGHMEACRRLGGEWMVVHAGYHFTGDYEMRRQASLERLVRITEDADCHGTKEEHLRPGEGNIHFAMVFRRLRDLGFKGYFMNAFGSLNDMIAGREYLARRAAAQSCTNLHVYQRFDPIR
jgi:sugar phosphate isomerase/epimerase